MKIFKNPNKVQVVDIIRKDYGYVVVVQNSLVVREGTAKTE
jgi:hypothetical protein